MIELDRHPSELDGAVGELGRSAESRVGEIEDLRRLPDDLAAELAGTGLGRAWAPARYGGAELPVLEVLDVLEALAWYEGGTAWCGMIAATTSLIGGYLPERWAEVVYGDPRAITGGHAAPLGRARPVEGGLVVNGDWQWGSGTAHSTYIGGGTVVVDAAGRPAARPDGLRTPFVLFEPGQVELQDTWYTVGLRGSGSTDYRVVEAFVPEGRWVEIVGQDPVVQAPLYRFPFFGALALGIERGLPGAGAASLGRAGRAGRRQALRLQHPADGGTPGRAVRGGPGRGPLPLGPSAPPGDRRGGVERRRRRPLSGPRSAQAPAVGRHHVPPLRARRRSTPCSASPAVRRCTRRARSSGCCRDVNVASQHAMVAPRTYELVGRMALGQSTDIAQL